MAATVARDVGGIDGARAMLGHTRTETTEIYARPDAKLAMRVAAEIENRYAIEQHCGVGEES